MVSDSNNVGENTGNSSDINNNNNNLLLPHNSLEVPHQNILGLKHKTNKLLSVIHSDLLHIISVTKHHQNQLELDNVCIENYIL